MKSIANLVIFSNFKIPNNQISLRGETTKKNKQSHLVFCNFVLAAFPFVTEDTEKQRHGEADTFRPKTLSDCEVDEVVINN